ncbi:hypothetical protein EZV62_001975 [Acer yangbiense]|uniref:DUF659 domain-containing protein n=1 Tax=Acer yangbiense TaxID=1000413 RepID=A0A5C7IY69_9ROSI|nr:hypothetical protein EZV62_001975 [Acer yangbiense]
MLRGEEDSDGNEGENASEEEKSGEEIEELLEEEMTISHQALNGGSKGIQTIKLRGLVKNMEITILVDSGSTHNFLDPESAKFTRDNNTSDIRYLIDISSLKSHGCYFESNGHLKSPRLQLLSPKSQLSQPKQKGPLDVYYSQSPHQSETVVRSRQTKLGENDASKKVFRDRACKCFARWMYDAAVPFNAVKHDSFQAFIEAVGQHGLDGWKDMRERTLINFLINSPKGSMFMESIDVSAYAKTGEKMFELFSKVVDKIGPSNVVQVVTDSASNNVLAGKLLEAKYPNLFWTPCAAHCLDLILEDIFKIPNMKQTFERAISVHSYIYGRTGLINMMRKFTKMKELLRPAKIRRRYEMCDTIDPIYLNNIDDSNEWLTRRLDDENDVDDELVFTEEDGLTWNIVATAAGVREPSYRTRQSVRGGSSSRAP